MTRRALGRHFTVEEFDCRDGGRVPVPALRSLDKLVTRYLVPLRMEFGPVTIHSGYRTLRHNRAVGGAPLSCHRYDVRPHSPAADVSCRSGTPQQWARFLDRLGVPGLGLYRTFVHLDLRSTRTRW